MNLPLRPSWKPAVLPVLLALSSISLGQDRFARPSDDGDFVFLGAGRSYKVLGARDTRLDALLGYQHVMFEPKFRFFGPNVRTVSTYEIMGHQSIDSRYPVDTTLAIGGMYGIRYVLGPGKRYYAEASSGIQFDTKRSHDLPSVFNFCPSISFGEIVPGKTPIEIALRLTHISNLYTERPNFGQDQVYLIVGVHF